MSGLLQKLNKRPRRPTREQLVPKAALPSRADTLTSPMAAPGTSSSSTSTPSGAGSGSTQELSRPSDEVPKWVSNPPIPAEWVNTVVPLTWELLDKTTLRKEQDDDQLLKSIRKAVNTASGAFSSEHTLSHKEIEEATVAVRDLLCGKGPLEPLYADSAVTDIFITAHNEVRCLRKCQTLDTPFRFHSSGAYLEFLLNLLDTTAAEWSENNPIVNRTLPDATRTRVTAIHPCLLASTEPSVSLRIPRIPHASFYDLIRSKTVPATLAAWLAEILALRECSILITGAASSGKTTLATALLGATPSGDRIVTIEETAEIFPTAHFLEKLITNQRNLSPIPPLTLAELAIQKGPQWIAYGDLKSGHGAALLRILESGTPCVATIRANGAEGALQILKDDLIREMSATLSNQINARLLKGFPLIAVMENNDGRPFLKALYETVPSSDSLQVQEILSFIGEQDGKRTWRLNSATGFWLQRTRDRGHELRIGAGLLPALE